MATRKLFTAAVLIVCASPVAAAEQKFELWLNPSVTVSVDEATFIGFETAQRFREAPAEDTYYARLCWDDRFQMTSPSALGLSAATKGWGARRACSSR